MISQPRILLLGDSCTDELLVTKQIRKNPEAPMAPLYTVVDRYTTYGMVLNVSRCLQHLGLDVTTYHPDPSRICKSRVIDGNTGNQICRIDDEKTSEAVSLDNVDLSEFDAVVISDYNKGYIADHTIADIQNRFHGPIFLDTKKPDLKKFSKCIIKINLDEARAACAYTGGTSLPMHENLIVTQGDKGAAYANTHYDAYKVMARDPCGAGDAFLAGLVYGCFHTGSIEMGIHYGIVNAGISVQHIGTYAPTLEELEEGSNRYYDQIIG